MRYMTICRKWVCKYIILSADPPRRNIAETLVGRMSYTQSFHGQARVEPRKDTVDGYQMEEGAVEHKPVINARGRNLLCIWLK